MDKLPYREFLAMIQERTREANIPVWKARNVQLPYENLANCHIKNRPTATFILRKMAGFGNNFVPLQRK